MVLCTLSSSPNKFYFKILRNFNLYSSNAKQQSCEIFVEMIMIGIIRGAEHRNINTPAEIDLFRSIEVI